QDENIDASQKAKIKWDIEADENSKFFHDIVNQKRKYLSIQGIKVDGIWIDDSSNIKGSFRSFFEKKFQKIDVMKIANTNPFYKSLTPEQNTLLTLPILETDIKDAIWDCGSDKSSGPDGFTFAFYKEFWNVVKKDILAFVGYFFTTGIIPRGCNTSFITLILKVPCPMVMHFMGFNETWIKWISCCLHSASASILINGSPTCEFNILRGLRCIL
nr:RNA-directed DNA polymerase, eukaryota [Tanacetum cinerariifolium]